jgi:uncharacterized protein YndB with AHSA1/START domain
MSASDRIERKILLKAPRARVWRALFDAGEFGTWFGLDLHGQTMAAGERVRGPCTYPGYEHLSCEMLIERVQPESLLSWRWHPAALNPSVDYSQEPTTLVVFELQEVENGTLLTVVETGFDSLPAERRAQALRINSSGWDEQMVSIEKHLRL